MNTGWLQDSQGPLRFRFISKLRNDGQVELVFFTQRQDNRKYILQHISFDKNDFAKTINAIREMIWKFFPKAKIEVDDFAEISPSAYRVLPDRRWALLWLAFLWRFEGMRNKLRWLFFRKPPR